MLISTPPPDRHIIILMRAIFNVYINYYRCAKAIHSKALQYTIIIFLSCTTAYFPRNLLTVSCFHLLCFLCTYHYYNPSSANCLHLPSRCFRAPGTLTFIFPKKSLWGNIEAQVMRYLLSLPSAWLGWHPSFSTYPEDSFHLFSEDNSVSSSSDFPDSPPYSGKVRLPVISSKYMRDKFLEQVWKYLYSTLLCLILKFKVKYFPSEFWKQCSLAS